MLVVSRLLEMSCILMKFLIKLFFLISFYHVFLPTFTHLIIKPKVPKKFKLGRLFMSVCLKSIENKIEVQINNEKPQNNTGLGLQMPERGFGA